MKNVRQENGKTKEGIEYSYRIRGTQLMITKIKFPKKKTLWESIEEVFKLAPPRETLIISSPEGWKQFNKVMKEQFEKLPKPKFE